MPIPAPGAADGVVVQTGSYEDTGNFVDTRRRYGLTTRYFRLLRFAARRWAPVNHGDVIGYLGNTGLSRALTWTTRPRSGFRSQDCESHTGKREEAPRNLVPVQRLPENQHGKAEAERRNEVEEDRQTA